MFKKKKEILIVCILFQYAMSKTCRMEFQFALDSVRIPVILVVVGTGFEWEKSEVNDSVKHLHIYYKQTRALAKWLRHLHTMYEVLGLIPYTGNILSKRKVLDIDIDLFTPNMRNYIHMQHSWK